ncbi:MAG: anaerobic ribonucleoside-triphosphate reductase activating protein [Methanosarcina flavescens]|jgi:pyruvate formate lyase activating enzyme|uniref:Anaerobic ribonucleoside-triphosphate reductase activating protein n=1 Tax=Methanosarcina flavescens TaxID=1715806 RepID=A0A660HT24_9EURY|nr:anaerobic ribonucleoside-triphosphate reductase activating protein [Methanosarcina flavescens]AYK15246.1 anaerobic ribonucleoside-triphosphate reductase activating protein [Methanosarcina flavescens]NLK33722.1 anaerobic ribonucleoside-triphosphate reductase activating protein [Methanosarcina flavescens]
MRLNYAGIVPLSTVDWRGKAATTIFFRGCPLRCTYCQNHPYLHGLNPVDLDFVKDQIKKSKPFVSAVVFSGGEPLMQDAIVPLAEFVREVGLAIGIHTNGCYPGMANELVKRKLVDKFFIDIKAPPDNPKLYGKVTGYGEYEAVKKTPEQITASLIDTLEIVDSCGMELELRTTLIRDFIGSREEIASIAAWISENIKNKEVTYVLQQGIPEYSLRESLRETQVLEREELYELGRVAKNYLNDVRIRTKENGEEIIFDSM